MKATNTAQQVRYIKRKYTIEDLTAARDILNSDTHRDCWGPSALVVAVLGDEPGMALIRERIQDVSRLAPPSISMSSRTDIVLALGIAIRVHGGRATRRHILFLETLLAPSWWTARAPIESAEAKHRAITAAASLSQTGTEQAHLALNNILNSEGAMNEMSVNGSFILGLVRANIERSRSTLPVMIGGGSKRNSGAF